ncbi:hypothetical protein ACFO0N_08690 [Halobium salinum]|uniref:SseB protein N-terminal domain-containing protein n=1 Tax=Halobium salinum TaxID=1364940 RepID=A0ABD5PAV1_9EURY|nr:hypothetical protein [Halobium salinum]
MNPEDTAHPLSGVLDVWERVVDDMEATAAEYREDGWETLELHPGDVTPIPGTRDQPPTAPGEDAAGGEAVDLPEDTFGLDALLPGDEFEAVSEAIESATFDEFEVFRADSGGVVFLVLAMLAPDADRAVLLPLYYATGDATAMARRAREAGEMRVVVRPLSDDEQVVFTQADPEPLLPEAREAAPSEDDVPVADGETEPERTEE